MAFPPDAPEAWLRGPVEGISPYLQPVAHALIQVREDVTRVCTNLTSQQLWAGQHGAASIGFHVQHLAGSIDRLFTYARGESLTDEQRRDLAAEGQPTASQAGADDLLTLLSASIDRAMAQLRTTPETSLLDARAVGRLQLPSTVFGLLVHAAEHAARHAGQIITTARLLPRP